MSVRAGLEVDGVHHQQAGGQQLVLHFGPLGAFLGQLLIGLAQDAGSPGAPSPPWSAESLRAFSAMDRESCLALPDMGQGVPHGLIGHRQGIHLRIGGFGRGSVLDVDVHLPGRGPGGVDAGDGSGEG